ncbi:iron chelate uptake ABC transporter family permease subunit [Dactylosporangium sp. AC04546]|uniref:FecCD family ABC transporter permease n=1 Tax=Dactylosporangium sp. AC04546 TaxID=2862460 RepID=UPI001EE0D552|nr:iron chelate uptake ABC transporter family permease subunit [Dactylosporangium sp. AC04546]WVK86871.1 iron chelate uptake ABC transporter family permease subunit [Dactylosporangium sp. AC04546]
MTKPLVDFGRPTLLWRRWGFSVNVDRRLAAVCTVLCGLAIALGVGCLMLGDFPLSLGEVLRVLTGGEHGFPATVVLQWRAPRVVAALVLGAAFGVAGAIFQSLTRNPLASPDVVGFATGSYTGALVVLSWVSTGYATVALGSLGGGLLTAFVVFALSQGGRRPGLRFILVGIAVSAMLSSVNSWLLLIATHDLAATAAVWGAGSLNAIGWSQTGTATAVIAVLLLGAALLAPGLRQLELGEDTAAALGVPAARTRALLILVGVGLTAAATAAAGPIAFVALVAPQIGRRLVKGAGTPLLPAAATGALLLLAADAVAQHVLPVSLPVGVVTVVIGGGYLVWLLVAEARRRL